MRENCRAPSSFVFKRVPLPLFFISNYVDPFQVLVLSRRGEFFALAITIARITWQRLANYPVGGICDSKVRSTPVSGWKNMVGIRTTRKST